MTKKLSQFQLRQILSLSNPIAEIVSHKDEFFDFIDCYIWSVANIAFGWLAKMGFDREIREQVLWLIRNHMKALDLKVMPICEVVPC